MTYLALSYGGGVDSTALAIWYVERGELPIVVHAPMPDWPETVAFVATFRAWWDAHGGRFIEVTNEKDGPLDDYCIRTGHMPMRSFRWCTDRWKVQPVKRFLDAERAGRDVTLAIGIDADEPHRARVNDRDPKWMHKVWPLVEHDIGRDECEAIIRRAGLPVPPKSGCYFCPFQRIGEWRRLYREHPDLWQRAEAVEAADPGSLKEGRWGLVNSGVRLPVLARRFDGELAQCMLPMGGETPCGCFDG